MGYIPGISTVSGSMRIGVGVVLLVTNLCIGDPCAHKGVIIGPYYDRLLVMSIIQIYRGITEVFVPFGNIINGGLDFSGFVIDLYDMVGDPQKIYMT